MSNPYLINTATFFRGHPLIALVNQELLDEGTANSALLEVVEEPDLIATLGEEILDMTEVDGALFALTQHGLHRFDDPRGEGDRLLDFEEHGTFKRMTPTSDGVFVVTMADDLLQVGMDGEVAPMACPLSHDGIEGLLATPEGLVVVGWKGKVGRFSKGAWDVVETQPTKTLSNLAVSGDELVIVGSGGLILKGPFSNLGSAGDHVYDIWDVAFHDGQIWLVSDGGLFRLESDNTVAPVGLGELGENPGLMFRFQKQGDKLLLVAERRVLLNQDGQWSSVMRFTE